MSEESEELIVIRSLSRRFGPIKAVDNVSFMVKRGEVLGFLGPNGAGKSTTMKMITGFLSPSAGSISVCDHDVLDDPVAAKRVIGYLPEGAPAYPDMTPAAFLDFIAGVRNLTGARRVERMNWVIDRIQIRGVLHQPIETLSKGFKRRVGLAQALLHDPDVLVLDEPTDGLDPNQKHDVRELIRELAPQKAIVISTHILEEVTAICTRAVIIARGALVADGTPAELEARSRWHNAVCVVVDTVMAPGAREAVQTLANVAGVEEHAGDDGTTTIAAFPMKGRPILDEVGAAVRQRGITMRELRVERGRLDEVFRSITTTAAAA
jgi:ABC-2 type transport system ATP-binding protein